MILVTGATGKNGVEITRRLSAKGEAVRGMVHKPSNRLGALPNVHYVSADFDDAASLRQILKGVERAFLVTNSSERVEERQLRFVGIASEMGVKQIVYLSQLHAALDSPLRFLRYHAVVEEALRASGVAFTHLRPNLYMQGLLMIGRTIATEGRFFAPAVDCRVSVVDVRDIGDVATRALTEEGHAGKTYDLTGPEALTHTEMAAELSRALNRPVTFVDFPEQAMREALRRMKMPDWQADGLIEDYAHYRRGEAVGVSSAVKDVTGASPRSFAEFARDYRDAFQEAPQQSSVR